MDQSAADSFNEDGVIDFELDDRIERGSVLLCDEKQFTLWQRIFTSLSIKFSLSAWPTVRGKPSRTNPRWHAGFERLLLIISQTISSDTKRPSEITVFTSWPSLLENDR